MSTKSSKPEIDIVGELPERPRRTTQPADYWITVAATAMQHQGEWLKVRIPHLSVDRHRQVVADIRHAKIFAFRWGGFDAQYIDGELYIRFNDAEEAA